MLIRLITNTTFHKVKLASILKNPSIIQSHLKEFAKSSLKFARNKTNATSHFPKVTLTFAGFGFGASVLLKSHINRVNCDENRTTADLRIVRTDVKFDWKRFWSYLKGHIWKSIGAIAAALAVAYLNIIIPSQLGDLINALSKYAGSIHGTTSDFFRDARLPAIHLMISYLAQSTFTFFYIFLLSRIGEQIASELRRDLFNQILIQDIEFFDNNRTGELVNRLTTDVQDFKSSFKQTIAHGLRSGAQLVGGSISLFIISPQLATIALISVPAAVIFGSYLGKSLRELSRKSQAQTERATNICSEAISNIRTVRSSAAEHIELMFFEQEVEEAAKLSQQLGTGIALFQALTNMFLNCMVLGTLYLGGHLMSENSITAGQLMSFLVSSQGVQRSLSQGSVLMGQIIRGMVSGGRVFEYLSVTPKIDLVDGLIIEDENLKGEIRFENVTFCYPSRPDQIVVKDFNLVLKPGQTVALVGQSGAGKSSIAALLERFYEPSSGSIYIDGVNLKDISPVWLRSNVIGYIDQQPILFGCSIKENIRYGRENATNEEILEASKMSQSHDFIQSLPDGYATNVGERGAQLSGGQRQRIAIARALLKEPVILILDEATSALDASSEAEVQKALDVAMANTTNLVIAHRLSTVRNADLIVVIEKGHIIEMGKHGDLIRRQGLYFELVKKQEKEDRSQG